jgi:hypothetical protein
MNDGLGELAESFERNPSRVAKTFRPPRESNLAHDWSGSAGAVPLREAGLINEVRLIPAPGAEDGVSSLHIAIFVQFKAEVRYAIVDSAVGGYLPQYDIPETRPAKSQGS